MLFSKKGFQKFIYIFIKALTYTDVPVRLAHFTHSASILWNRKNQRSLVRGRGTSIYYIFLYSGCTIKTTILQSGLLLSDDWCLLPLIQPLSPPRPKTPFTHIVYLYNDVQLSKGHLGYRGGGEASQNKLKDTSYIFWMTNITLLSIFRTHAQKAYCKVLETKCIYILNNLVLLLFENL